MLFQCAKPGRGAVALSSQGRCTSSSVPSPPLAAQAQLLDHRSAFLAGLAGGQAQLDDLPLGKQAWAGNGGQHLAPIRARAADDEHAALGVALRAPPPRTASAASLRQQRLVAVDRDQRAIAPCVRRVVSGCIGEWRRHPRTVYAPAG